MAKYDKLSAFLKQNGHSSIRLTFAQIDQMIGGLPDTARRKAQWWANENMATTRHTQCKSWQSAGYQAAPDLNLETVIFTRAT